MTSDPHPDQQPVPAWAQRILTARRFLVLEWVFGAVFIGAWVFGNPTTGRIVVGCLIAGGLVALSLMGRRFTKSHIDRLRTSEEPIGLSGAARVAVWITFAAVVGVGFWFGLQSGLG